METFKFICPWWISCIFRPWLPKDVASEHWGSDLKSPILIIIWTTTCQYLTVRGESGLTARATNFVMSTGSRHRRCCLASVWDTHTRLLSASKESPSTVKWNSNWPSEHQSNCKTHQLHVERKCQDVWRSGLNGGSGTLSPRRLVSEFNQILQIFSWTLHTLFAPKVD